MSKDRLYNKNYSLVGCRNNLLSAHRNFIERKILRWLDPQKDDKILEMGCNRGGFVKKLQNYSDHVVGIDINKWAVNNCSTDGILAMNAERLAFKDRRFNKIVSSQTIEHIRDLKGLLREMSRILTPNGSVVLVYPFEIFRGMAALRSAWITFHNPAKARELHVNRLSPGKIKKLTAETDLKFVEAGTLWGYLSIDYYTILTLHQ